jgi:hypothetical protein
MKFSQHSICTHNEYVGFSITSSKGHVIFANNQKMYDLKFSRWWLWRMPSSGKLRHVTLVKSYVSEEWIASIIRVARIDELGTMLAVTSNRSMLWRNSIRSSETSVLKRATRHNIPEDGILQLIDVLQKDNFRLYKRLCYFVKGVF